MPNLVAEDAFDDVFLGALTRYVPCLVALEAEFLSAVEGVVGVLATEDAAEPLVFVGALASHVAELLAVPALDGRIGFYVVPGLLVLQLAEHIVEALLLFLLVCFRRGWHP